MNKMEKYSNEAKFLSKTKIDTYKELILYKEKLQKEITEVTSKREKLWKSNSKSKNANEKTNNFNLIANLNQDMDSMRAELKLCEDIELRIPKIKDNLQELRDKNKVRKEKEKNEYIK